MPTDSEGVEAEPAPRVPLNLKQAEAMLIQQALEQAGGNMSEAARLLGIDRKTLYRKLAGRTYTCHPATMRILLRRAVELCTLEQDGIGYHKGKKAQSEG